MKLTICDVCKYQEGKVVESIWRISRKDRQTGERIAIDACDNHKDFFKGTTDIDEARKKVYKLMRI